MVYVAFRFPWVPGNFFFACNSFLPVILWGILGAGVRLAVGDERFTVCCLFFGFLLLLVCWI